MQLKRHIAVLKSIIFSFVVYCCLPVHAQNMITATGFLKQLSSISLCSDEATHIIIDVDGNSQRLFSSTISLENYEGYYVNVEGVVETGLECSYIIVQKLEQRDYPVELKWQVPLAITCREFEHERVFGVHPTATGGFDRDFDEIAAPPGFLHYAYFYIESFPNFLTKDIKGLTDFFASTTVEWTLRIVNANHDTTNITWDYSDLPMIGSFTIFIDNNVAVNMRVQDSLVVFGNQQVRIRYDHFENVTYQFSDKGWYLISLPVIPILETELIYQFPDVLDIVGWNSESQSYEPTHHVNPGKGFWFAIKRPSAMTITGIPLHLYKSRLIPGWHLVGCIYNNDSPVIPHTYPPQALSAMFAYDFEFGKYDQTEKMIQQNGYWVTIAEECDWCLDYSLSDSGGTSHEPFSGLPPSPPLWPGVHDHKNSPAKFKLFQNYPNPFNSQTMIQYYISITGYVNISIYDVLGKSVRTLINEVQVDGHHNTLWNGRDSHDHLLPSGVYFYRIEAGKYTSIRKMLMLK